MNFIAILISSLIPMIIGFIWYNDKTFGKAWMASAKLTQEDLKTGKMALIFGLTLVFSFFIALSLQMLVIHQMHVASMLFKQPISDPTTEIGALYKKLMDMHGTSYRTFKHGCFHGVISTLFLVMPLIGINALFERKSIKYILIHTGYWAVTLGIMGGILSAMV